LVVILWQLYIEGKERYHHLLDWPPPKLKDLLDELVEYVVCPFDWCKSFTLVYSTTCGIHKLMRRKSENSLAKRVLLGYFGIRDHGKFNKYQQRLGVVASRLQSKPHNIRIQKNLREMVHSREEQLQDSDSELAGGEFLDKKSAKKMADDKRPTAKGYRRMDRRTNTNEEARVNQDRGETEYESDEEDLVEGTSAQGSQSSNAAYSKTRKKKRQAYEDDENLRDRASKRKSRSQTNPVTPQTPDPPPRRGVSISFTNGSGNMMNQDIANTYNTTRSE